MKRNFFIFILYMLFCIDTFSYINIYPLTFDKRIDGVGEVEEYTITNITDRSVKYKITLDKNSDKNDMSDWIEVYPKSMALQSGEEGKIKVYINSPKGVNKGEYSAVLHIEELKVPRFENNNEKKLIKDRNLKIYTNLKMKIYGYVGELEPQVQSENIKFELLKEQMDLSGIIKNSSDRRVYIEVLIGNEKEKYLLTEKRLRVGERLNLKDINLLSNVEDLKDKRLEYIYILEKRSEKLLGKIKI